MEDVDMDEKQFDGLIRAFGQGTSRRGALGLLAAAAGLGLREVTAKAKNHKRKGNGKDKGKAQVKPTCGKAGASCSGQPCCSGLICPNGTCVKAPSAKGCEPNWTKCNGVCTNLATTSNCGVCGAACL